MSKIKSQAAPPSTISQGTRLSKIVEEEFQAKSPLNAISK